MTSLARTIRLLPLVFLAGAVAFAADYFPPRGAWEKKSPAELGFDAAKLAQAIAFAQANENPGSKDLAEELKNTFGRREPLFQKLSWFFLEIELLRWLRI